MFNKNKPAQIVLAVLITIVLFVSVSVQANANSITWYTGGSDKLNLKHLSVDNSSILFSGTTSQKTLMVKVEKKGGRSRSNTIPIAADGSFNIRYLIKDGAGSYTVTFFGSVQSESLKFQGLGYIPVAVDKKTVGNDHELNTKILEFVDKVMGTTVKRGECWDLAQKALDTNLADWERPTKFGIPVSIDSSDIKAGDIIQFHKLTVTEHLDNRTIKHTSLGAPDHTAIIYKVLGKKQYTLAHQNVSGKRIVTKSDITLANVTGGKYSIYRPVAQMLEQ